MSARLGLEARVVGEARLRDRQAGMLAALATLTLGAVAIADGLTTLDVAFTPEQAERGRQVYDEFCLACHDTEFYRTRLAAWQNTTVAELYDALSATMPSENPGALADDQYLDVLAYVFSITGSPAGSEELSLDNMGLIEIVTAPVGAD